MGIKAKLKSSSKITDVTEDVRPSIHNSNPLVNYETVGWGPIISSWFRTVILFIVFGLVLALGLYAGLSATIAYAVNIDGKYYGVARDTYVASQIPKDADIYASRTSETDRSILGQMLQGAQVLIGNTAVEDAVRVKILAGPTMKVSFNNEGNLVIDSGEETGEVINMPIEGIKTSDTIIDNNYIVECTWGECEEGEIFLLPAKNVAGEVISLTKGRHNNNG